MATISLNAYSINQMPEMIKQVKKSVEDYKTDLFAIKMLTLNISQSVCSLEDVVSSIQASTKTQEDKIDSLDELIRESEEFISDVVEIDGKVADVINQRKDEFYKDYYYLKPECEKTWTDKAKDALKSAAEWCCKHWKLMGTVFLLGFAIGVIIGSAGAALVPLGALYVAVAKGILIGSAVGGLVGGIVKKSFGGSFWEGFEDGAFGGAISGAISGVLGHIFLLGKATLALGDLMYIGAASEFISSLIGDIGDVLTRNENMTAEEVMLNAIFSFVLGGVAGAVAHWFSSWIRLEIPKINKGIGSWSHVWETQSTRSLLRGSKISLKSLLKGVGSKAVDDVWDYVIEGAKSWINELKESWKLNDKILNILGVWCGTE